MKKYYIVSIVAFILYGCNYRIFINGKKSGIVKPDKMMWVSTNDTALIFHVNDTLPDAVTYINTTKIEAPFVWINQVSPNNLMTEIAKNEAAKINANVIKVTDYGGRNYKFTVKMYNLNQNLLKEYRKKLDSAEIVNRRQNSNICLIHVRAFSWEQGALYFNDSLVGKLLATTHKTRSFIPNTIDLKLNQEGWLSSQRKGRGNYYYDHNKFWLKKGHEYYFSLGNGKHGNYLIEINKYDYY